MIDDAELLRRYDDTGSEEAFSELVRRNLDLVYATARRHLAEPHFAEDVAQSVFIDLARKASALRHHPALVSWLYTSARYAALKTLRASQRRQAREHAAHLMHEMSVSDPTPDWERLRPLLDDALHQLDAGNRQAILLRYFRDLPFSEVATTMRIHEGAARTRVNRALEKLNRLLAARGIRSTSTALGVALASQPIFAAPAGLAATISGAALAGASAGSASLGLLETLLLMSKLKLTVASAVVIGSLATAFVEVRANRALHDELQTAALGPSPVLRQDNQALRAQVAQLSSTNLDFAELARLRSRAATLQARPPGVTDDQIRPMRNVGRATPAAAMETFVWALVYNDLDLAASFLSFSDDTPENRAAFMARFSPVVQARYRTPERLLAQAFFGVGAGPADHAEALQVYDVSEDGGPTKVNVKIWWRQPSGREGGGVSSFRLRDGGWAEKPFALMKPEVLQTARELLDPATGDFIPPVSASKSRQP